MNTYFSRFKRPLSNIEQLRSFAINAPSKLWAQVFGFTFLELRTNASPDFFEFEKKFKVKYFLLKVPEKSHYRWHTDAYRGAAINTILTGNNCYTLFSESEDPVVKTNVVEVDYSDDRPVVFNTQIPHTIFNLGPERIVFSVGFDLPVTFEEVIEYCANRDLLE